MSQSVSNELETSYAVDCEYILLVGRREKMTLHVANCIARITHNMVKVAATTKPHRKQIPGLNFATKRSWQSCSSGKNTHYMVIIIHVCAHISWAKVEASL